MGMVVGTLEGCSVGSLDGGAVGISVGGKVCIPSNSARAIEACSSVVGAMVGLEVGAGDSVGASLLVSKVVMDLSVRLLLEVNPSISVKIPLNALAFWTILFWNRSVYPVTLSVRDEYPIRKVYV